MQSFHRNILLRNTMNAIRREYMKPAEMQSLQQLAAVKLAILVCESEDMQQMIGNFSKAIGNASVGYSDYQWQQLCCKAFNMLAQNGAAKAIIDIVLNKMWPISFEVFKWIIYHVKDMGIDSSPRFFWTLHLNIDYEKTARLLTKNETLSIKNKFKLACFYCLDHEVRTLWQMMSLSEKRSFFVRGNLKTSYLNPIILYWTYYIQEVPIDYWESKTLNHTQLFKYAVENGYLNATKYFLRKFTIQHQNGMVLNSLRIYLCQTYKLESIAKGTYFSIGWFLMNILPFYIHEISYLSMLTLALGRFLEWPLQKKFTPAVDRVINLIFERSYGDLLEIIFKKDLAGFKDYDYKKLFKEFWLQSREEQKTYVNEVSKVGFKMFFRFTEKHFGFVFDENSLPLKAKFRSIVVQQEIPEDSAFHKKDVEFFKFLIQKRVTTKASILRYAHQIMDFPFEEFDTFFKLPLEELMHLIDGIMLNL